MTPTPTTLNMITKLDPAQKDFINGLLFFLRQFPDQFKEQIRQLEDLLAGKEGATFPTGLLTTLKPEPKKPEPPKPAPKPEPPKPTPLKPPEPATKPKEPTTQGIPDQPTVKPDLVIKRTHYPKWWNDEGVAKISLSSPGSQFVISARGDYSLFIGAIVISCNGECDITFTFGEAGSSGAMHFGGSDEPRGMVIAMGNSPAPCGSGSFTVTASGSAPADVGGFVSFYLWKK